VGPPAAPLALAEQAARSPLSCPFPGSTLSPSAPTHGLTPVHPGLGGKLDPASPVSRKDRA